VASQYSLERADTGYKPLKHLLIQNRPYQCSSSSVIPQASFLCLVDSPYLVLRPEQNYYDPNHNGNRSILPNEGLKPKKHDSHQIQIIENNIGCNMKIVIQNQRLYKGGY
jgi:hypothetical protein